MENREISALQTGLAGHFIKRRLTEFGASAALSDISVGLSPNAWNSDGIVNPCRGRRVRDETKLKFRRRAHMRCLYLAKWRICFGPAKERPGESSDSHGTTRSIAPKMMS
jgi:hypothetical protein